MELERRNFEVDRLEVRGTGDGQTVRGQAVPYNRKSADMGGWVEVIAKGAATASIKNNDIALLWQHDNAQPISRVSANRNPLIVEERSSGVWFEQNAAAFTEFQLDKITDGVVHQMSFGFFAVEQEWDEAAKPVKRTVSEMDLVEFSPVTFAAYPVTHVSVRAALSYALEAGINFDAPVLEEMLQGPNAADVQRMLRNKMDVTVALAGLNR